MAQNQSSLSQTRKRTSQVLGKGYRDTTTTTANHGFIQSQNFRGRKEETVNPGIKRDFKFKRSWSTTIKPAIKRQRYVLTNSEWISEKALNPATLFHTVGRVVKICFGSPFWLMKVRELTTLALSGWVSTRVVNYILDARIFWYACFVQIHFVRKALEVSCTFVRVSRLSTSTVHFQAKSKEIKHANIHVFKRVLKFLSECSSKI